MTRKTISLTLDVELMNIVERRAHEQGIRLNDYLENLIAWQEVRGQVPFEIWGMGDKEAGDAVVDFLVTVSR